MSHLIFELEIYFNLIIFTLIFIKFLLFIKKKVNLYFIFVYLIFILKKLL